MRANKRRIRNDGKPGLADGFESRQGFHWQPDHDLPDNLVRQLESLLLRQHPLLLLPLPLVYLQVHGTKNKQQLITIA